MIENCEVVVKYSSGFSEIGDSGRLASSATSPNALKSPQNRYSLTRAGVDFSGEKRFNRRRKCAHVV
jgi:hypothetical protein